MGETAIVSEVRVTRVAAAPRCNRLWRLRRWRWTVTYQRTADGAYPGVPDLRVHVGGNCGYTFTRAGAALAAGRRAVSS